MRMCVYVYVFLINLLIVRMGITLYYVLRSVVDNVLTSVKTVRDRHRMYLVFKLFNFSC